MSLLDWTGRQVRLDKRGAIPADLLPILERLAINAETWLDTITSFGRWFHRATWIADNNLGSPVDVVDNNGALANHIVYAAFGQIAYQSKTR